MHVLDDCEFVQRATSQIRLKLTSYCLLLVHLLLLFLGFAPLPPHVRDRGEDPIFSGHFSDTHLSHLARGIDHIDGTNQFSRGPVPDLDGPIVGARQ